MQQQPSCSKPTALGTTTGRASDDPAAKRLAGDEAACLERWRAERWQAIEQRLGSLAPRDPAQWYEAIVFERLKGLRSSLALPPAALAFFYSVRRAVPRPIQLTLRRMLAKLQRSPLFPAWPFDEIGVDLVRLAFADELLERGVDSVLFPWFWPDGRQAAVALTHDVESAAGLSRASEVAGWEELEGFRSSFNVVMGDYPLDAAQLERLRSRGHEIGSHAIHHDRSLFASRRSFEQQLPLLREAAAQLGAEGFRSPATHRVVEWLSELPFSYDCTMPHSDPYEPIPGGTGTIWPFLHGDVVELPYTAPQDHTLFNLLSQSDGSVWREQLDRITAHSGLFQIITHPDQEYLGRSQIETAYRELLASIAERRDLWVALPKEIARWWRGRARRLTARDGVARWSGAAIVLAPAVGRDAVAHALTPGSQR